MHGRTDYLCVGRMYNANHSPRLRTKYSVSRFLGNYSSILSIRFLILFLCGGIRSKDVTCQDSFFVYLHNPNKVYVVMFKKMFIWIQFLGIS